MSAEDFKQPGVQRVRLTRQPLKRQDLRPSPFDVMLVVLLSAALHAGWNALVKSGDDPLLDTVIVTLGVAVVGAAGIGLHAARPAHASWPFLIASVVLHLVYYGLLVLAYREGDLSLMYPVMRARPPRSPPSWPR